MDVSSQSAARAELHREEPGGVGAVTHGAAGETCSYSCGGFAGGDSRDRSRGDPRCPLLADVLSGGSE